MTKEEIKRAEEVLGRLERGMEINEGNPDLGPRYVEVRPEEIDAVAELIKEALALKKSGLVEEVWMLLQSPQGSRQRVFKALTAFQEAGK